MDLTGGVAGAGGTVRILRMVIADREHESLAFAGIGLAAVLFIGQASNRMAVAVRLGLPGLPFSLHTGQRRGCSAGPVQELDLEGR